MITYSQHHAEKGKLKSFLLKSEGIQRCVILFKLELGILGGAIWQENEK
jgi:hypothetical protein